ncbi:glycosyltransferase family 4 protein [Larkinella rosea]|uniref:Glycosyltransferase family 1 protein n=1 Tax=Larkinella rosea TaxID=2025312 RepID=A0A3P1BZ02_9BACT|nr:glycosyltransferase family 4 protein [Larkinella rosea]RRB06341.1 glycosyltransferase family 1 protein [Larkinella rosea]
MKILIVHNILWAHYKATVFSELHRLAPAYDCQVHVLQIAQTEQSRVLFGKPDQLPDQYSYELLFDTVVEQVGTLPKMKALVSRMRAYRPDMLLITGYYDPAQIALMTVAKLSGIKVIIQTESTPVDLVRSGAKEWLKSRIISMADGFFCFGTPQADYLIQLGVRPEKILVHRNAVVDNSKLRHIHDRVLPDRFLKQTEAGLKPANFIYVGRLAPEKNITLLIDSFHQALQKAKDSTGWGLILLGDGNQKATLLAQIDRLHLQDSVQILPNQPWYRVPETLALADVLVLPSLSEPWGLVVNEAMACGMPVVVSNRCGCAQDLVQHNQNGYVFDPLQPGELTTSLLNFIDGRANQQAMSLRSEQIIAEFDPQVVGQKMMEGFVKVRRGSLFQPSL